MKLVKRILILVLICVGLGYIYQSQHSHEVSQVGAIAPNFLNTWFEKDHSIDLKKPTLYIAWSSSCPKCIISGPKYNKLYKKYKKHINFIGVSPSIDDGSKQLANQYNKFPMNHDPKLMFFKYFGIDSFPYYVVVDADQKIISQGSTLEENDLIKLSQ
ncbi:MAG: redoxin family protein [Candidatus Cloacimonetes bacterium]|nr:redoxin family protein [Candidatus Cloacimonadota bacterium]